MEYQGQRLIFLQEDVAMSRGCLVLLVLLLGAFAGADLGVRAGCAGG
jgi:hypothetical protein